MELKDCKVGFKRGRKYFRGELVSGKITKVKQVKHLSDIPKFGKYITIKFFIRKSKSNMNLDELLKTLNVDSTLYLLVDEIPVAVRVKKSRRRGKPDKVTGEKVYKVDKLPPVNKTELNTPISTDLSPTLWSREFFRIKNPLCLSCVKKCKQSARVSIIVCPPYKKKG
jgi:hypothetical protein